LFSNLAPALAQEGTPPVEPPTATFTEPPPPPTETPLPTATFTDPPLPPTATFTDTPLPTETPLPTNTDTAVPMMIPTNTETTTQTPTLPLSATATATETPTETTTGAITQSPTAAPTLAPPSTTAIPIEPDWQLQFSDNFSIAHPNQWIFTDWAGYVPVENGSAMRFSQFIFPTRSARENYYNVAVQVSLRIDSGAARFLVRQSSVGDYRVTLDSNSLVTLSKQGAALGSFTVNPVIPGQWRTLRFAVSDGTLRVTVDGVEIITVRDETPLRFRFS